MMAKNKKSYINIFTEIKYIVKSNEPVFLISTIRKLHPKGLLLCTRNNYTFIALNIFRKTFIPNYLNTDCNICIKWITNLNRLISCQDRCNLCQITNYT